MHGLQETLLPKDEMRQEVDGRNDDTNERELNEQQNQASIMGAVTVCILAGVGCEFIRYLILNCCDDHFLIFGNLHLVAASAAAMVSVPVIAVFVAGGLCCLNAPL